MSAEHEFGDDTNETALVEAVLGRFHAWVNPDEAEARASIKAGAFDSLASEQDHALFFWDLDRSRHKKARVGGRTLDLFPGSAGESRPDIPLGEEIERLRGQFEVLGFLVDRHPMVLFAERLPQGIVKARDLPEHVGRRVDLAGWLITGKTVLTRTEEPMQFLTFEDETDLAETTFFPKA